MGNSSLGNHLCNRFAPLHCGARPSAPHSQSEAIAQSNTANTRIVCGEIQDSKTYSESSTSDSCSISKSTIPVIASVAKQSIKGVDCHAGLTPARNDDKTESKLHANLESKTDSENPSGEARPLRDKNQIARSANLEGVVGVGGLSRGEGATSPNSSPSPLDEKNTKTKEVNQALEAKNEDSQAIDSESKKLANRDISNFRPQYDKGLESYPHASLEFNTDSELTPAVGHCPTAIESHSGERCSLE